jgi:hypothetical protein
LTFIDPTGMDSIYFQDQANRPQDNGTQGTSYTATVWVVQNNQLVGIYPQGGYKTINEGEHLFNNKSGHHGGKDKGLNLVNESGAREVPGTLPNGKAATVEFGNIHEGYSNKGNFDSRGSIACLTLNPVVSKDVLDHFDWSGTINVKGKTYDGTTGNSTGSAFITRGSGLPPHFINKFLKPIASH